ncbi:MAG TPA: TetR/AcrR family transcriptional regulator [Gemmataceae bacterium]|nr:TetR/AcrR family transcriptional regulator [Gemmataceae bacterium]
MKNPRIDIASIRKEQIVEAAVAVIAEQGLHNLSLSEIENKAGMSRGQLTYYFPAKEAILLAVFDRVLQLMYQRLGQPESVTDRPACEAGAWEWIGHLFTAMLTQPPVSPEFHCLQYTFLSQIGYREDFRQRLASLYEEWRSNMTRGLEVTLADGKAKQAVPPRAMATLIQALLHGLAMQAAADPTAFDGAEMLQLCLDVLGTYLGVKNGARAPTQEPTARSADSPDASAGRPPRRRATRDEP